MSQIVVGVDGSPAATTVALWAAHEAAMLQSRSRSGRKQPDRRTADYHGPGIGRGHLGRGSSVPDGGRILSSTVRSGGHVARPRRVTA